MRYAFRLAELLGHTPDRRKRPGTIKAIVEYTGLDRHQVAALLKNEAKYIPIEALSRLCDYLIEHGYAKADQLPGALFAIKPENFWELLARRRRLEVCVGVRRPPDDFADAAWVVASDAVLAGEVLNGVSTLGGTAKAFNATAAGGVVRTEAPPHLENLKQSLVWSPATVSLEEVQARSQEVYDEFSEIDGDKALICLGSVKSNLTVEIVMGSAFGCDPFVSQDDVATASDRSCPIFLRYRDSDPHPPAASAGLRLSKSETADQPGLYYEKADGSWAFAGGGSRDQDAALVFYIYRESLGRLEMILSGFSGRATRLLARTLAHQAEIFWPPIYQENYLQIGAFIVQYSSPAEGDEPEDILRTDLVAEANVIPLPVEAIQRRLNRVS
ncbi:MAG: helix-turn-helix transcriptional regulator [Pirellulaceae bacterium]|nr:helix-turn-helix transcriptional regulator [Pirellulaceae bacterium]